MTKTPEKSKDTEVEDPIHAALDNLQESGLGTLAWMGTTWVEAMSDLGSEVLSFIAERISEDVKTQHEILHCKTMTELQQVQAAFLERAYVQYTVETGKLVKMGTEVFPPLATKAKTVPI